MSARRDGDRGEKTIAHVTVCGVVAPEREKGKNTESQQGARIFVWLGHTAAREIKTLAESQHGASPTRARLVVLAAEVGCWWSWRLCLAVGERQGQVSIPLVVGGRQRS